MTPSVIDQQRLPLKPAVSARLQRLRAVAAMLVVVDHSLFQGVNEHALGASWSRYASLTGAMGVAVFFVISGLIMYRTTDRQLTPRPRAARAFLLRRIVRVVPLYWVATLVASSNNVGEANFATSLLKSLFFVPFLLEGKAQPFLGVGWTLNYEMFFYALFAMTMLLPRRAGLTLLLAVLVTCVALGPVLAQEYPGVLAFTFYSQPLILLFGAGVLLGALERRCAWRAVACPRVVVSVVLGAYFLCLPALAPTVTLGLRDQIVFDLVAVLVVLVCTTGSEPRPIFGDLCLERAGDASYSTYLFHGFMLTVVAKAWFSLPHSEGDAALIVFVTLAVVAVNAGGWAIHVVAEAPLTRVLGRRLQRDSRPLQPVASAAVRDIPRARVESARPTGSSPSDPGRRDLGESLSRSRHGRP